MTLLINKFKIMKMKLIKKGKLNNLLKYKKYIKLLLEFKYINKKRKKNKL
jgi:hypothetical protein